METAPLLTAAEPCARKGHWFQDWQRFKFTDTEMLQKAIRTGLTSTREDYGDVAGEECMALGADPGLLTEYPNVYDQTFHLCCLSDILTSVIRKPKEGSWRLPERVDLGDGLEWVPSAYVDPSGSHLRRIVLVSSWNEGRHYSECRAWASLGEICCIGLPMQMVVAIIGPSRDGKRHSPWSKAFAHPVNKKIRFKRRNFVGTGFKDTWEQIWREDHDEISTETWAQTMLDDSVLADHLFSIEIPLPTKENRQRIVDLAKKKLDIFRKTTELPMQNLSTCDWPVICPFRNPCHSNQQPSGRFGFINISRF